MNLIIDAGNTAIKLAVFNRANLLFDESLEATAFVEKVKAIFREYPNISSAIVSATGVLDQKDIAALTVFCKVHILDFQNLQKELLKLKDKHQDQ